MVTQAQVKELLDYDPATGLFRWRVSNSNRVKVGAIAGSINAIGYRAIGINGRLFLAHRLAWIYMHESIPAQFCIDHVNGIKNDNRLVNLRLATRRQQQGNLKSHNSNTSGHRGVFLNKKTGKYYAHIGNKHLGTFSSLDEARSFRDAEAKNYWGEFYQTRGAMISTVGEEK
ncbi:MAG: HNH endonuclease [Bdellovibrionaceae bacterium]|jgi:hypothetical protein|nr:HNH endonuclease [Pseudobdellovibrionaceae bacterium]